MALQVQQEIITTLKKIDGEIRRFAACLDKAKKDTSVEPTSPCMEELQALNSKLREHRDHVRKCMATVGSQQVKKNKLADARERIECEMRRFQDFQNGLTSKSPKSLSIDLAESVDSDSDGSNAINETEVKVTVDQVVGNSDLVEEFTCKICLVHVVGCGPQLTRCSHLFCGDCMSQWFAMNPGNKTWAQRAQAAGAVPCPVCKEPLHKDTDLHPVCCNGEGGSKMLFRMLSDTKIVCANNPKCDATGNCSWVGDYGSYQEHIRSCKNVPLPGFSATAPTEHAMDLSHEADVPEVSAAPVEADLVDQHDVPEVWDEVLEVEPVSSESAETSFSDVALPDTQMADASAEVDAMEMSNLLELLEMNPNNAEVKVVEVDNEDVCSTDASERFGSFEGSDPESPEPSEKEVAALSDEDHSDETHMCRTPKKDISPASKRRQAKRDAAEKAKLSQGAQFVQAAQTKAAQAQLMQYQAAAAAQYQAACYHRAAQMQMAQFQAARMAQWQAQTAYAMQGRNVQQAAYAQQAAKVAMMNQQANAMQQKRARAAKQ